MKEPLLIGNSSVFTHFRLCRDEKVIYGTHFHLNAFSYMEVNLAAQSF